MYDIVIIGAGTAGLSAAIYAVRAGKKVLVLESNYYGGQIVNAPDIENYPGIKKISGYDFAVSIYEQAKQLGAEIEFKTVTGISKNGKTFSILTDKENIECRAVIIAAGARHRHLGLDKEENLVGKGVSYCAVCDGNFYKEKVTAVVGGGNTAIEDAEYLAKICRKVYVIHHRSDFKAEKRLMSAITKKENVELIIDSTVTSLIADEKLTGVEVENIKSKDKKKLEVDALFIAIGFEPQNDKFTPLVELDERGYISAGENCKTNVDGVFAAGDCRTKKIRQLSTAASDGSIAALSACEYLSKYE